MCVFLLLYDGSDENFFFFFSSRRRHTRYWRDWSSDVCSSDLEREPLRGAMTRVVKDKGVRSSPASRTEKPCPRCRKNGMRKIATKRARKATSRLALPAEKVRIVNSRRSYIGWRTESSVAMNTAPKTTKAPNRPTVLALPHPQPPPSARASSRQNIAALAKTAPGKSNR